jgi:hypothetical protein
VLFSSSDAEWVNRDQAGSGAVMACSRLPSAHTLTQDVEPNADLIKAESEPLLHYRARVMVFSQPAAPQLKETTVCMAAISTSARTVRASTSTDGVCPTLAASPLRRRRCAPRCGRAQTQHLELGGRAPGIPRVRGH